MKKLLFLITTIFMIAFGASVALAADTPAPTEAPKEIKVEKPEVTVKSGKDRFTPVHVDYKTKFSDDLKINSGDKVVFTLPKELNLQTSYDFDVKGNEGNVVGKATASVERNDITTVFNDYFTKRPLNKTMQLSLMTVWNNERVTGTDKATYNLDFNGTVIKTELEKDGRPDPEEIVTKWGVQKDKNTVNWWGRVNYKKANLTNAVITDKWDSNQEYVEGSLQARVLSSIDPWTEIGTVDPSYIKFNETGFTITMPTLNDIVSLNYLVRLKDPSKNPTNNLRIQADNNVDWDKDMEVQIAKGDGSVDGENRPEPTYELPNEAPVLDKPELNINDVPLMPPPPVVEKPELDLNDIPMMPPAPILEKPELDLNDVPLMPPAPILEKPELDLNDIPMMPPAPILEKPELDLNDIPLMPPPPVLELPELEIPVTPNEETPTPKENNTPVTKQYKEPVKLSTERKLPNTGLDNSSYVLLGLGLLGLAVIIKRSKKEC